MKYSASLLHLSRHICIFDTDSALIGLHLYDGLFKVMFFDNEGQLIEEFDISGEFKFRGAKGVGTYSSGNHAAALALAAQLRGTRVTSLNQRNFYLLLSASSKHTQYTSSNNSYIWVSILTPEYLISDSILKSPKQRPSFQQTAAPVMYLFNNAKPVRSQTIPCGAEKQRSSGKRDRHGTPELSDSSTRCTDSCSTELTMGCELLIARYVSITINKLKANIEKENAIESCIRVTLYRKEEEEG
ncbi:hypothetical protein L2E82_30143 [Cichorium intybus]|uniref:Uncharacterized protein n=1 Tax=Cichorium intybus TaxID=13427 RepID=A0ACB9CZG9_CICIN|nr:hypothetical protein L2E82_30143 [Cichorium intybus]